MFVVQIHIQISVFKWLRNYWRIIIFKCKDDYWKIFCLLYFLIHLQNIFCGIWWANKFWISLCKNNFNENVYIVFIGSSMMCREMKIWKNVLLFSVTFIGFVMELQCSMQIRTQFKNMKNLFFISNGNIFPIECWVTTSFIFLKQLSMAWVINFMPSETYQSRIILTSFCFSHVYNLIFDMLKFNF